MKKDFNDIHKLMNCQHTQKSGMLTTMILIIFCLPPMSLWWAACHASTVSALHSS